MAPSLSKIAMASIATAILIGTGISAGTAMFYHEPTAAEYELTTPYHTVSTQIHDPDNVLTDTDIQLLNQSFTVPEVVRQIHFIVFANNDENVNDTVEYYLRSNIPETIDGDSFSPGTLFVGVGLDPRAAFIFAGDDVANTLDLRESEHLHQSIDAIKPAVINGFIGQGLVDGLHSAIDIEAISQAHLAKAEENRLFAILGSGAAGASVAFSAVFAGGIRRRKQEEKALTARKQWSTVAKEYGELASRLDHLDIRAHSLQSPLVDTELRNQWEEIKTDFLKIHDLAHELTYLHADSSDNQYRSEAKKIARAFEVTESTGNAEKNIEKLFALENGDAKVRTREIQELINDINEAITELENTDTGLYHSLVEVRTQAQELSADTDDPHFMNKFVELFNQYRIALEKFREQTYGKEKQSINPPRLDSEDYRPGYGYNGFVPYWVIHNWYTDQANHNYTNSNSSYNTSFSSGFSGAGGSSSF
ncbi:putative secreted protein [Corynebacterium kutscheri]|uniref:Secreted protein n=1 Tax=Corynebacterium kutscheri TaxID=35755 RepID=A0A0F6R1U9_9CORY|nr:hypothetical protein [Corynebacterium kutscheri]AKE41253.1 hypothetical protein UL82_05390 [Corynebacterium kutscheri]VEH08529.1 putative secreted protein [Corynebacterium kutscheri]VEH09575.1 putative secreted protein [Corynebacterium kutscheri]VEH79658.1 putative secreted protein [Corynebacterium kutscheri]